MNVCLASDVLLSRVLCFSGQGMVSSQSMGLVPTPPKPSSGALSDMQDLFM